MSSTGPQDQPPPPPPPGAPHDDWRQWRRATRRYYRGWGWTPFWGVALIVIGGYFLLKNLGLLYGIDADVLWPILLILLGVWLLVDRMVTRPPLG